MSKRNILILLFAISIVAFIIRVVYPFNTVFGLGFVNFIETDAWSEMYYARQIVSMPFFEGISYTIHSSHLFSWIIAQLSLIAPIELVGAWLPPVLAVATVIVVYFIGRSLFNDYVAVLSALFIAVMPSEFLGRSLLGFADHHILEVLLLSLVVLFAIKAIQAGRLKSKWVLLSALAIFLYCVNWNTGFYLIMLILLASAGLLVVYNLRAKRIWSASLMSLVGALIIAIAVYLPLGGYERLLFLIPGQEAAVASHTTGEILNTAFTPSGTRTISELMPMLYPDGKFSLVAVASNFHLFVVSFILGGFYLWRYRSNPAMVILVVLSVATLAMAWEYRRFIYYFSVPVAILSALACYELAKKFKGKLAFNAAALAVPLILFSMIFVQQVARAQPFAMSPDWHNALVWLEKQPDKGNVSAWSDFGHWIKYVSDKTPNYLPGPGGDSMASLIVSEDHGESRKLLDKMNTGYLIIDEHTLRFKVNALKVYSGVGSIDPNAAFGYQLYAKRIPEYLNLLYENQTVKVFEYMQTQAGVVE